MKIYLSITSLYQELLGLVDSYDDMTPSVQLASQYLAYSSLSEDISQYNFSISGTAGVSR